MTKQPIKACRYMCDRCGWSEEVREATNSGWAAFRPGREMNLAGSADVCPGCYDELIAWWRKGALAAKRHEEQLAASPEEQDLEKQEFFERAAERAGPDPWGDPDLQSALVTR